MYVMLTEINNLIFNELMNSTTTKKFLHIMKKIMKILSQIEEELLFDKLSDLTITTYFYITETLCKVTGILSVISSNQKIINVVDNIIYDRQQKLLTNKKFQENMIKHNKKNENEYFINEILNKIKIINSPELKQKYDKMILLEKELENKIGLHEQIDVTDELRACIDEKFIANNSFALTSHAYFHLQKKLLW